MEPVILAPHSIDRNEKPPVNKLTEKFNAVVSSDGMSNTVKPTVTHKAPFNHSYHIRLAWIMGNKDALHKALSDFRSLRDKKTIVDLDDELEAYKSLETLNDDLRNELRYEFAGYFGRMIEITSFEARDRLFQSYIEYGVESIAFEGCEIDDVSGVIFKLGKITSLKHLNLRRLNLKGVDLDNLPKGLVSLILSYCEIENDDLKYLPPNLDELILLGNEKLTDRALDLVPKKVKILSLCRCTGITGTGLKNLGPQIEALFLDGCSLISDKEISEIPKSVKVLSVSGCNLTDEGLLGIPREVEELVLWQCSLITDKGIAFLPPKLQLLNIAHTLIEGTGFSRLPSTLKDMYHSIGSFKGVEEIPHFNGTIRLFYIGEL